MNNPKTRSISRAVAGALFVLALGGCASTPTQESTGQYFDDSVLTTKVKAALVNDTTVSALNVKVDTFKGIVQLSGFVKSAAQRDTAVELARAIPGVQMVKDDILIR